MNDQDLIAFLYRTGHFFNPDPHHAAAMNVAEADLSSLKADDRVVALAVKSFQESDANLVPLAGWFHGRAPVLDGNVGPATRALAALPRCPVPDHPPPPGVRSADPGLDGVFRSMQEWAAGGSGSWPVSGCDPEHRGIHSIRVGINTTRAPAGVKSYMTQALAAATACYAEMGLSVRYILDGSGTVEIVKRFESLGGNTIGWNYFPRGGCTPIEGRLSSGYAPEWRMWANLEVHETGHGVGLEHTRGHIMNPSILLVWPLTWKGSPSESTMRRYFGGEPLPPITPPVPPVPPIPDPPPVTGASYALPDGGRLDVDYPTRAISYPAGWTGKVK